MPSLLIGSFTLVISRASSLQQEPKLQKVRRKPEIMRVHVEGPKPKNAETDKNDESNKSDKNYKNSLMEARMRGHV